MNRYQIYKHFIATDVFNVRSKVNAFRKPKKDANKNRQRKN